jgi:AcrR family transcriptional regulator
MNGATIERRAATREAIMDALAEVVVEKGGLDFSVQEIANRAGVTHRTVYNHFPTREALREGLAEHVEARLAQNNTPPDAGGVTVEGLPAMAAEAYATFETDPSRVRAYVVLMLASRGFARVAKKRTSAFRKAIESHAPLQAPVPSHAVAAAVRMFLSATGWHLLTELHGLTPQEAAATARWATQTLLDAATRNGSRRPKK